MIILNSIKIRNHKCFGDEPQGFEKIFPINIIIGKNNSGKSSLIDMIEYLIEKNKESILSSNARCIVEVPIEDDLIEIVTEHYAKTQGSFPQAWKESIKQHAYLNIKTKIATFYLEKNTLTLINNQNQYGQFEDSFYAGFKSFFKEKHFRRINAERDILPESYYTKHGLGKGGKYATSIIWKYLNAKNFDQNLIKKEFLIALNSIINPDILFTDITIKEDDLDNRQNSNGELYFENNDGNWVALSKMGSGIKTIILVLLNLIVIPAGENIEKKDFIFGFEELENNLHPSLQRRLFNFINEYAKKYYSYFFITTHSNIPIDLFSKNENAQIIHVEKKGTYSFSKTVGSLLEGKNILKDLDYKASDILLSNGVIWVEGPSDALYLELLLDLYKKSVTNSISLNYCVQALSTAIWKYAGFTDFDWEKIDTGTENQIISLSRIHHNHVIVIDNDNNYEDKKPSEFQKFSNGTGQNKARLILESMRFSNQKEEDLINNYGDTKDGKMFFWINSGTFETYLEHFIKTKGSTFEKYFDLKAKRGYFEKKREGNNYSKSKVELAAEIANFTIQNNLTFYDFAPNGSELFSKIQSLFTTIKYWNS